MTLLKIYHIPYHQGFLELYPLRIKSVALVGAAFSRQGDYDRGCRPLPPGLDIELTNPEDGSHDHGDKVLPRIWQLQNNS